jgi:demethylmenaquinone methyltransferase / 2-methoxy-6-polyprenyl-1,4-benzoquinol methylase
MPLSLKNGILNMTSTVNNTSDLTHFGFQSVSPEEKRQKVEAVFHSVASQYDRMNDAMSMGLHRLWKHWTVHAARFRPQHRVLDLAGGTGDMAKLIVPYLQSPSQLVLADLNASMLSIGRDRLLDAGYPVTTIQCNAECLPFPSRSFDRITIAFGLRNVVRKELALKELARLLKPGGEAFILEFSPTTHPALQKVYDWYSFTILPKLGQWLAQDADSYQYLAESIRMHPEPTALQSMMEAAGFDRVEWYALTGGIVALHRGIVY